LTLIERGLQIFWTRIHEGHSGIRRIAIWPFRGRHAGEKAEDLLIVPGMRCLIGYSSHPSSPDPNHKETP